MYSEWGGQEQSMDDQQKIWKSKATVSFACFDERDDDPPAAIDRGEEKGGMRGTKAGAGEGQTILRVDLCSVYKGSQGAGVSHLRDLKTVKRGGEGKEGGRGLTEG
jgi:hypothetical protein